MKGIFLGIVVVCSLVIAGIGGVFANYQDIETSHLNYVETGDLDLKVTYGGRSYDDPNVPMLVDADNFMPECQDKSFHFDLHNVGVYEQGTGYVYFHVKNLVFTDTGKTEPELAAELGNNPVGELDNGTIIIPGGAHNLGADWGTGAGGELAQHLRFDVYTSPTGTGAWTMLDLSDYDTNQDGEVKLSEVMCNRILICELDSGDTIYVKIDLWLQDVADEDVGHDLFPADNPFNDWPTNALQNDKVEFDISFELFQFQVNGNGS